MELYKNKSSNPARDAQQNLMGRTHYADPDTLRFHKSRVLESHVTDGGLIYAIVESCAADYENTRRIFRPVIFDLFGNVIERPKLDEGFKTRRQAVKAMWAYLNSLDAKQITMEAIERTERNHAREMAELRQTVELWEKSEFNKRSEKRLKEASL